ncbi:MAG TPA: NAD(P)-dependent oxidoreductase [Xanthobacteraceae bacterium]|nr:NAD(P)-dependent oxidoreductase [Xanthobacteraceae bacterium]
MAALVRRSGSGAFAVILLMYSNYVPSADHVRRLEDIAGPGRVAVTRSESDALARAASTEIVMGHRYMRQLLPQAPRLRWVQTTAAGFDQLPWRELRDRGVVLSRNPLNAPSIAHHAISLAWALLRRLPLTMRDQAHGVWGPPPVMLPLPRSALVLGLGAVGMQVAKLLRGLGLRVRGSDRAPTDARIEACDEFIDADHWRDALARTDILVLAVPLDDSTRHCIGARELARLPEHAIVVNISRAGVVDQTALIDALRSGGIAGAALDVLDPVPAPDDPLWATRNLLITPKVAAFHPGMQADFEAFAEAQMQRYLSGASLEAIVSGFPGQTQ